MGHDKRDELGSTWYDYRHARMLENVRRRQSGANYAVNYRPCMVVSHSFHMNAYARPPAHLAHRSDARLPPIALLALEDNQLALRARTNRLLCASHVRAPADCATTTAYELR